VLANVLVAISYPGFPFDTRHIVLLSLILSAESSNDALN
jgi:hypothetical protein